MKRLIDRAYAPQRLISFRRIEQRQREDAANGAIWAAFVLIVVGCLLLSGWLG